MLIVKIGLTKKNLLMKLRTVSGQYLFSVDTHNSSAMKSFPTPNVLWIAEKIVMYLSNRVNKHYMMDEVHL